MNHPEHERPRPTRILHVLEATLGGTRRILEGTIEAFAKRPEFQHALVYSTDRADSAFPALLDRMKQLGWRLYPLDMVRRIAPVQDFRSARGIVGAIESFEPDIVHCRSAKGGGLGRLAIAMLRDRPKVVYSPHALPAPLGRSYMVAERLLSRYHDEVTADSDSEMEEILRERLATRESVSVVYPGLDCDHFAPRSRSDARAELGVGDFPLIIGIGRLTYQKDPLTFVRALSRVLASVPQARAIWVGDGEMKDEFEQEAQRLKIEHAVQISGWCDDIRQHVAAADVVLSTSVYESFGFLVAEPLAMGRPVVATGVTGPIDILRGWGEALAFAPCDDEAAAQRVIHLLRDEEYREEVGARGREIVSERFSLEAHASSLSEVYDRLAPAHS